MGILRVSLRHCTRIIVESHASRGYVDISEIWDSSALNFGGIWLKVPATSIVVLLWRLLGSCGKNCNAQPFLTVARHILCSSKSGSKDRMDTRAGVQESKQASALNSLLPQPQNCSLVGSQSGVETSQKQYN